jgi:tripeptide aminopeptidase
MRYAAIDTQSDETSASQPSTAIQFDLLNLLRDELISIGAADAVITEYGVVLATIPGTVADVPTMGLVAHVDTAPAFHAEGVKPRLHPAYDGGEIRFPDDPSLVLSPVECPYLGTKTGQDIITASGLTLLGADDKAGVAIIMTMAEHLLASPDVPRGPIRIAFTPDEEIGRGVDPRLAKDLGAAFAYTLDGADVGSLEYESFSADGAVISIKGVSAHPGWAKDVLVNALYLATKIVNALPLATRTPEVTDGRDGFVHVYEISGGAAEAQVKAILRDFERDGLTALGNMLTDICTAIQKTEPRAQITCKIQPQYRNMRYWLEDDMTPVDLARAAYRDCGIEPLSAPIRGGTDGSRLTEMGVPTPNLFTGMQNIHGPLEWISVQDMEAATRVCIALTKRVAG